MSDQTWTAIGESIPILGPFVQASANENEANKLNSEKQAQIAQQVALLQTQQGQNMTAFNSQQALQLSEGTQQEQNSYTAANASEIQGQEQIGGLEASAASGASSLVASAASRGLKVGAGAANSGLAAARGSGDTINPAGGYGIQGGNYSSKDSPLYQLAAMESNAGTKIGQQKQTLGSATNLAKTEISEQAQNLVSQQSQDLSNFQLKQSQELASAQLGEAQSAAMGNLTTQAYDSSQWVGAFANSLNVGTNLANSLIQIPTTATSYSQTSSPDVAGNDLPYEGW